MGQRLDRPSTTTNGGVQSPGQAGTTLPTSLSTTFSSSSASSTSSASSNTSGAVANPANGTPTASSSQNGSSRSSNSRSNHRHRRHHRSRASESDSHTAAIASGGTNNNGDMSPRTRFRHEMARRGYTNNSSDLFVRLFQFPSQQGSSQTSSNSANPAIAAASESASTTPTPSSATGSRSNSSGLSAFRFFNLGGNSSSQNTGDLDSDLSSDEDEVHWNHNLNSLAQSLPFFFGVRDFKCFVCNKQIPADDVEAHIMMCLTKPRLTYNEDVLTDDKGECIICFEELEKGQTIARLQCLCIYHKHCIDDWLTRSQSCPGHPPD